MDLIYEIKIAVLKIKGLFPSEEYINSQFEKKMSTISLSIDENLKKLDQLDQIKNPTRKEKNNKSQCEQNLRILHKTRNNLEKLFYAPKSLLEELTGENKELCFINGLQFFI